MMKNSLTCKLCGLPVRSERQTRSHTKEDNYFCCTGCKMVYSMLVEADPGGDPKSFKETDLYKRCLAASVIPNPEEVLASPIPPSGHSKENSGNFLPDNNPNSLLFNFTIENMWCPACAWIIEEALLKTPGIRKASCNFSSDRGRVLYDPVKTSPDEIMGFINSLGYRSTPSKKEWKKKETHREFIRLSVCGLMAMNVMMLSWALYSGFFTHLPESAVKNISWPVFFMASVVFFYGGLPIHKRAWAGTINGTPGMEALISTGSSCAYFYSILNMLKGSLHLYFDTSSMLIVLVLLGKMLERSARDRITKDLDDFFTLVPEKVRICTKTSPEGRYVSVKQLHPGDLFRADPGEIIPADGPVEKGTATLDESSLTGEPRPVTVKPGDTVKSGSRVIDGSLGIRAAKTSEESALGQMISVMEQSLAGKSPAVDKYEQPLKVLVPAVIGIAILTGGACRLLGLSLEESVSRAVTVMVISCPCALGIAVPLALIAGVSTALKKGILVRDYGAFEKAGEIQAFVFDKTGTITTGKWQLLHVACREPITENEALAVICGMEKESDHYIARTVIAHADLHNITPLPVERVKIHPNGLTGTFRSRNVALGSRDFIENNMGKKFPLLPHTRRQAAPVVSRIYLSLDNKPASVLLFGDTIRAGAEKLINTLKSMNLYLYMVSGDADSTTAHVALKVGIQENHGKMLPHEKAAFLKALRKKGGPVAMVGDGINDAPAMACADLAVALHSGFDPGREVAAVSLMRGDPLQLLDFLSLSKRVNGKVTQNLWFALIYNLISIPVAMTGLLTPLVAVTAMLLSSLSVTGNTLLLIKSN